MVPIPKKQRDSIVGGSTCATFSFRGSSPKTSHMWTLQQLNPSVFLGLEPCTLGGVQYATCSTTSNNDARRQLNLTCLYLFLITIGIGTKPVKVNFWTRLFSGFSGVTSAVYRLPFESTDKWCRVPNCPFPEPHDPNPSRNSSVLRLNTMICAWLRFATYR